MPPFCHKCDSVKARWVLINTCQHVPVNYLHEFLWWSQKSKVSPLRSFSTLKTDNQPLTTKRFWSAQLERPRKSKEHSGNPGCVAWSELKWAIYMRYLKGQLSRYQSLTVWQWLLLQITNNYWNVFQKIKFTFYYQFISIENFHKMIYSKSNNFLLTDCF